MEFVFVVPRNALFPEFYPQGLLRFSDAQASAGLSAANLEEAVVRAGFFVERAHAERTPSLKQLIPYSIVQCDARVLLTRRLSTGGERRLHNKFSIGIGGHINPEDLDEQVDTGATRNPIDAGTRREISEELEVSCPFTLRRIGILNDDSNPVGAVHLGVVQVASFEAPVGIREREQLEGRLVSTDELRVMLAEGANFETWSKLLIPHLDELLPKHLVASS